MTSDSRFVHLNKTKMCKFEALGKCKKGRECPFAHASDELRPLPDLRCTKLCKSFILTGICPEENCVYAHSKEELRSTGTLRKTKLCRFVKTGHCALGSKCNFAHSKNEIRNTDEDLINAGDLYSPEDFQQEDQATQQSVMLPPGLGWEEAPMYSDYTDIYTMKKDIADLNALAHALDGMLSQLGQAAGVIKEPPSEVPRPQQEGGTLAHDLPAYVHMTATPDDWSLSAVTSQPIERSNGLGTLSFDNMSGDGQSISTRSPPSPPSPPSPSEMNRDSWSEHTFSPWSENTYSQAMPDMSIEGAYGSPLPAGGMCQMRASNNLSTQIPLELFGNDPRLAAGPLGSIMGA